MPKNNVVVIVSGKDDTGATFDAIQKHLSDVEHRASETDQSLSLLGERFTRALEYTGIYFGIHEIVDGFKEMVKSAMDTGVEIGHLSKQTGISAENLSVLKYAAEQTDVSFETFTKGFKKLSESMFNVQHGSKQSIEAFGALGISAKDLTGTQGDMYKVLELVADRMSKMPDGWEKNAAATELFGRAGQDLIPVLDRGASGIEGFRAEAEDLGLVIGSDTVEKMEELHRESEKMKGAFEGLALEITSDIGPSLADLANKVTFLMQSMRQSPGQTLKGIIGGFLTAIPGAPMSLGLSMETSAALGLDAAKRADRAKQDADSAMHTQPAPPGFSVDDSDKLGKARDKAAEVLRQAQGRTSDTSGYRNSFRLQEQMQQESAQSASELAEAWSKASEQGGEAAEKSAKAQIEAALQVNEGKIRLAEQSYSDAEREANFEVQMGQMSADQRISILRDAAQKEHDIKLNALSDMAALDSIDPDHPEKVQRDLNQIEEMKAAHAERMTQLDQQEAQQRAATISGIMHEVLDPLISKPKSVADAFKEMADNIIGQLLRIEEQKLIQGIVGGIEAPGRGSGPMNEHLGLPGQAGGALGKLLGGLGFGGKKAGVSANGGLATGAGTLPDAITGALSQGKNSSGSSGVVVNLITQGTSQQVESSGSSGGDGLSQHVISIVLKDAETLGPMSKALAGAMGQF